MFMADQLETAKCTRAQKREYQASVAALQSELEYNKGAYFRDFADLEAGKDAQAIARTYNAMVSRQAANKRKR